MVRQKDKLLFVASVLAGSALWLAFDLLKTEPWDTLYGAVAILGLGFVFGYVGKEHPFIWTLGIFLGQAIFGFVSLIVASGPNFFLPLGLAFLVPFTMPALVGALAGADLAKRATPAALP
jgi:hypothetical protein